MTRFDVWGFNIYAGLGKLISPTSLSCCEEIFSRPIRVSRIHKHNDRDFKWTSTANHLWIPIPMLITNKVDPSSDSRIRAFLHSSQTRYSAQCCTIIQTPSLTGGAALTSKLTTWWTLNHQTGSCSCHPNVPQRLPLASALSLLHAKRLSSTAQESNIR